VSESDFKFSLMPGKVGARERLFPKAISHHPCLLGVQTGVIVSCGAVINRTVNHQVDVFSLLGFPSLEISLNKRTNPPKVR
jgi:hypothetical protein